MSVILAGVNAKYIHTNLAIRYLYSAIANDYDAQICEFSINDNPLSIEREIILKKPDIVAFSCYIWNINLVLELCSDLKKAMPSVKIILGGPEVSYDALSVMRTHPFVDYIIIGEGEITFPLLFNHIINGDKLPESFKFVKEGMVCRLCSYKDNVFSVEPPMFVELEVTATEPGVRGNTATNVTKPATVETGAEVKVPIFINEGDVIKIDTRTCEYLERV